MAERNMSMQSAAGQPGRASTAPDAPRRVRRQHVTKQRLLLAAAALFAGAIVVNAVAFQTEKHPSPLFRALAKAPETFPVPPARPEVAAGARAPAVPAPAPKGAVADRTRPAAMPAAAGDAADPLLAEIQRELAKRGLYKGETDGRASAATTQAIREFQFSQRVAVDGRPSETLLRDIQGARASMKDELADLLKRTAQTDRLAPPDRPAQDEKTTRTIADVQRALNKAGYGPLTEDGQMGPSTRQALAKFEADRKLPPRGEAKGQVLRVLASASGLPITQ